MGLARQAMLINMANVVSTRAQVVDGLEGAAGLQSLLDLSLQEITSDSSSRIDVGTIVPSPPVAAVPFIRGAMAASTQKGSSPPPADGETSLDECEQPAEDEEDHDDRAGIGGSGQTGPVPVRLMAAAMKTDGHLPVGGLQPEALIGALEALAERGLLGIQGITVAVQGRTLSSEQRQSSAQAAEKNSDQEALAAGGPDVTEHICLLRIRWVGGREGNSSHFAHRFPCFTFYYP